MGCGASKVTPQTEEFEEDKPLRANGRNRNKHDSLSNGHAHLPNGKATGTGLANTEKNGDVNHNSLVKKDADYSNGDVLNKPAQEPQHSQNEENPSDNTQPQVSKAVAFDIVLGQNDSDKVSTVQMPNRPPRRLQKIESAPVLTREALAQRQAAAELNRQKELQKKVKVMSRRRTELLMAREMDKAQQQKAELEEKLTMSERNREKHQAEIKAKQRRREEKAKRVRNKAKQIQEGDDVVGLAVDHDETYNADEEDESWDVDTSHQNSRSSNLDGKNSLPVLDNSKEESDEIQNNENTTNEQENLRDVHDFFDS